MRYYRISVQPYFPLAILNPHSIQSMMLEKIVNPRSWFPGNFDSWRESFTFETKKWEGNLAILEENFDWVPGEKCTASSKSNVHPEHYQENNALCKHCSKNKRGDSISTHLCHTATDQLFHKLPFPSPVRSINLYISSIIFDIIMIIYLKLTCQNPPIKIIMTMKLKGSPL